MWARAVLRGGMDEAPIRAWVPTDRIHAAYDSKKRMVWFEKKKFEFSILELFESTVAAT